jgi:hypothetical protein
MTAGAGRAQVGPDGFLAYLTGFHTMTSHIFIQRGIVAMRGSGARTATVIVGKPGADRLTDPGKGATPAGTVHILRRVRNPHVLLCAGPQKCTASGRTTVAFTLAVRVARPGFKDALLQAFHMVAPAIPAGHPKDSGIRRPFYRFADSSCRPTMQQSQYSGFSPSFTSDPSETANRHSNERIAGVDCACVGYFARSRAIVPFAPVHCPKCRIVHCGVGPDRDRRPSAPADAGRGRLFMGWLTAIKGADPVRGPRPHTRYGCAADGDRRQSRARPC